MKYFARWVHCILGCFCALFFILLCVTGGLYLFRDEIERAVDSPRYYVDESRQSSDRLPIDELVKVVEDNTGCTAETVCWHDSSNRTCRIILKNGTDTRSRLLYDVDPYTAIIKGQGAEKTAPFFRAVKKFHATFGLPKKTGRRIVLIATIAVFPLFLSGFILWMPAKKSVWKNWTNRMSVHWSAGRGRLLYDLHNVFGFFLLFPLSLLAATGVYLSYSPHGETLASLGFVEKKLETNDNNCRIEKRTLSLEAILKSKKASTPNVNQYLFRIPDPRSKEPIRLETADSRWCGFSVADVSYWNPRDGSFIASKCYDELSPSERLLVLSRPIHNGSIFGIVTKLILLVVCFGGATLPISGLCILFRRKKRSKAARHEI